MTTKNQRNTRRVIWVAAMVLIAVGALLVRGDDPRPVPFGWQMYSADGDRLGAVIIGASGDEQRIDVDSVFFNVRAELRPEIALGNHLCQSEVANRLGVASPSAVVLELGAESERFEC